MTVDDPLETAPDRAPSGTRATDDQLRALYVRLPETEFDDLSRAAFELRAHKRQVVTALIRRYVDPHSEEGMAALRELIAMERTTAAAEQ